MINMQINFMETTRRQEAMSMTLAAGLHVLIFLWNPILLKSDFKPVHDFVDIEVVESAGSPLLGGEAPKKSSVFSTLRDMLLTPKTEEIAHVAPTVNQPVAAPSKPVLTDKSRKPIAMPNFQPQTQNDDLAALKNPDQIQAPGQKVPNTPIGGPTLKSKSFGGIKAQDLPFQVSGQESVATSNASNIPIAVGNNSAKSGLGYTGPSLNESSKRRVGIVPGQSGTGASNDTMAIASAAQAPIAVGTGGTGTAPTGAATGSSLQQRSGFGKGGMGGGGHGTGLGSGYGAGVEGMPGAASGLEGMGGKGGSEKTVKHKGFEISGPLTNRPITYKVIPEYPAWAEEQGIMGSVRLYFTVDSGGNVRSGIRVTKTTGYPALDQLGIDALKQWKFAPLAGAEEGQWGIITFNFSLAG
jgi:TonB family protein